MNGLVVLLTLAIFFTVSIPTTTNVPGFPSITTVSFSSGMGFATSQVSHNPESYGKEIRQKAWNQRAFSGPVFDFWTLAMSKRNRSRVLSMATSSSRAFETLSRSSSRVLAGELGCFEGVIG